MLRPLNALTRRGLVRSLHAIVLPASASYLSSGYSRFSSSKTGSTGSQGPPRPNGRDDPTATRVRKEILEAALRHVVSHGWTDALTAGAQECGYPSITSTLLPEGPVELVWHVMRVAHQDMNEVLSSTDLAPMAVNERVMLGVRTRLTHFAAYGGGWAQAMALGAAPTALPTTLSLLASASDDVWWAAGDRSVDLSWYSRRALLMGVFAATEVFMLTDHSPGHADTWAFLARRCEEVQRASAQAQEGGEVLMAAGKGAASVVEGVFGAIRPLVVNKEGEGLARCIPKDALKVNPEQLKEAAEGVLKTANTLFEKVGVDPMVMLAQMLPPSTPKKMDRR